MNETSVFAGGLILSIGFAILIITFYILLIRWIFKINRMEKLQQKQVDLLTAIARMQGVDADTLNTILRNEKTS